MKTLQNLKKALLLAVCLTCLLASGCSITDGSENDINPAKTYKIIEIEEHEYIFISRRPFSSEMALAHKANCKNATHDD